MIKTCPICKKEFETRNKKQQYCSKRCFYKAREKNKEKTCPICEKKFIAKKNIQKYCSPECSAKAKSNKNIEKVCPVCERIFYVTPCDTDQICCKRECAIEYAKNKPKYALRKYQFIETTAHENKLYQKWKSIKSRCTLENYKNYAGRGIHLCDEWQKFENFYEWAINNDYQEGLTIERIDVNGNYCPENCKWIPFKKQARNRRTTLWVKYKNNFVSLAEVAEKESLNYQSLFKAFKKNNNIEDAIRQSKRKI